MAYTKQTWETGQVITAEKLNHMEDGIEGAYPLVLTNTSEDLTLITLSETWQTIHDAFPNVYYVSEGRMVDYAITHVTTVSIDNGAYYVYVGSTEYVAATANDYPTYTEPQ